MAVKGIERFSEHFAGYEDRYVLIGGTASTVAMEEAGLAFRATKDLDIVLSVEALDREFGDLFWKFVRNGGYQNRQQSTGEKQFYRFEKPSDETFPLMLELFSRLPDALILPEGSHLTPIPVAEAVSSLSAILLDDTYYDFIQEGKHIVDGLSVIGAERLVPLKARAWNDLQRLQQGGVRIQSHDVNKHRGDVFRLFQVVDPTARLPLSEPIRLDLQQFLERVESQGGINLKDLGITTIDFETTVDRIREFYGLGR